MEVVQHHPWGIAVVGRPQAPSQRHAPVPVLPPGHGLRPAQGALFGLALGLVLWALVGVLAVAVFLH